MLEDKINNFRIRENFPVASILVPKEARSAILALYKFARTADEISDDHKIPNDERKEKLQQLYNSLKIGDINKIPYFARDFYRACNNGKMNLKHGLSLLEAFMQDTEKKRYDSWKETLNYCQHSAASIGRMVLEANGEFAADIESSDKICSVLQLINHLQDLKADHLNDDRSYFSDITADVNLNAESADITKAKHEIINRLREMLYPSANLIATIKSFRLRAEVSIIFYVAESLLDKLEKNDVLLQERVELTKFEKKKAVVKGLILAIKTPVQIKYSAAKIACKSGSSFVKPLLRLDKDRKKAMLCFYSFCRLVDDAADEIAMRDKQGAILRLSQWYDEIEKIYSENSITYPLHPISRELALYAKQFGFEKEHLLEIIKGQEVDINGIMLKPSAELLESYCYRVASCVGLVSVHIFGHHKSNRERIYDFAVDLGKALQFINIMRDVQEDANNGRIYLPQELLEKHGLADITCNDISSDAAQAKISLAPILREMGDLAETYFAKSMQNLPESELDNMKVALMMKKVYHKYLIKMREKNFIFDKADIFLSLKDKLDMIL